MALRVGAESRRGAENSLRTVLVLSRPEGILIT
jgi:hypothetical protein